MKDKAENFIFEIAQNIIVNKSRTELIQQYLVKVKSTNKELTKREAFKDMLNRYAANTPDCKKVLLQKIRC